MACATQTVKMDEKTFDKMENEILKEVMDTSKSLIETFKFRMIYGLNVTSACVKKTSEGLKKFRSKNWDKQLRRKEAYEKYLDLY